MAEKRNRRSGVEDRWTKSIRDANGNVQTVPSANHGKGMRWRARFIDDTGNERAKKFQRKSDAQKFLDAEVTAKLVTGMYIEPSAGRVTVSAVYQTWFAAQSHISAKTAASRRSVWNSRVEPQGGDVLVAEVRSSAVCGWIAAMVAEGTGTPIIENAFGVLRQVLGAAVEDNRVSRNPCDGVKLPKRKHADRGYLSHEQVAALASNVQRDPEVVRFLAYTGRRWGKMAALRVQDFDMLRRRVNVSRSVTESGGLQWSTPKSWERRSVPFPAALVTELAALMAGKGRHDLVFTDQRGGVLRNSNWRARVFRSAVVKCQAADNTFPTITPHDLRHTATSLAVSARAKVKTVQRMLGHAKASMTLDILLESVILSSRPVRGLAQDSQGRSFTAR
jgi:integrase